MNIESVKSFKAIVNFGLEYGYTQKAIDRKLVLNSISKFQQKLIKEQNVYLSCSISDSVILLNAQNEKHLKLEFINYPKFLLEEKILKTHIESLVIHLMKEFEQNRVVIEYLDETKMIEFTENVDERVINR